MIFPDSFNYSLFIRASTKCLFKCLPENNEQLVLQYTGKRGCQTKRWNGSNLPKNSMTIRTFRDEANQC